MKSKTVSAFKCHLINVEELTKGSAASYSSNLLKAISHLSLTADDLDKASFLRKYNWIRETLAITKNLPGFSDTQSACKAFLRFLRASVTPPSNARSMDEFGRFLKHSYVKRTGEGDFESSDSYITYLKKFCLILRLDPTRLHRFSKSEMRQSIVRLEDLHRNNPDFGYAHSSAEAYYQYIRYTEGFYNSGLAA